MQKENDAFYKTIHCGKEKAVFHYSRFGKHEGNELKGYLYQKEMFFFQLLNKNKHRSSI